MRALPRRLGRGELGDTNLPFLCDPALREHVRRIGEDPETLPGLYVRMLNDALQGVPADLRVRGFTSTLDGNALSEEEQWRKLRLVAETAREIWPD